MSGFRLNPEKDADIIKDLSRFKDGRKSERIKEMYRKALAMEQGAVRQMPPPATYGMRYLQDDIEPLKENKEEKSKAPASEAPLKPFSPIVWNIPVEPTVKRENSEPSKEKSSLKSKILSNGF